MSTLQSSATMPEDELFNDQVDLILLSTMISVLAICEFPDEMWAFIAERMGGEEEGFTADNVHQHFNKCLKNGELIQGEDGTKVFLGGEELIEHKVDVGEIDAVERDLLLSQIDENLVGLYIREAIFVGRKILEAEGGVAEEADDSDE